jgi:putative PIN family toxin of toxin-antitoxin system
VRITADTNIYVSAFQFGGKPLELLELARAGAIHLTVSEPILEELKGVLKQKFQRSDDDLRAIEEQIRSFAELVTPTRTLDVIKEDPPDNRILECAEDGKSEYIVSGDLDLLRLGQYGHSTILRVADFLKIAQQGKAR